MIWLKYAIIAALFFMFSLLEASFFPFFSVWGAVPDLVFALFFLIIFFEHPQNRSMPITIAIIAGIISDMFLPGPFGISITAFLIIYFLHTLVSHFLREGQSNHLVFYFAGMFSVLFLLYYGLLYLAAIFFNAGPSFGIATFISLAYTLVFALAGFWAGRKLSAKTFDSQLKLL